MIQAFFIFTYSYLLEVEKCMIKTVVDYSYWMLETLQ